MIPSISISDFTYTLPDSKIAEKPLAKRDDSKLLVYNKGNISSEKFTSISNFLPQDSLIIFNDTKVVPARLHFSKTTGAVIEIFCLEQIEYHPEKKYAVWKCMVGNAKRWKEESLSATTLVNGNEVVLKAILASRNVDDFSVRFEWSSGENFYDILEAFGNIPLPPYIKREVEEDDKIRYQTVYAKYQGSVAAPTAGLHFTDTVLQQLTEKNITKGFVTLHVSAGTFRPVKTDSVSEHTMHAERFVVTKNLIEQLISFEGKISCVGTTSVRVVESLYWIGTALIMKKENPLFVTQWQPYTDSNSVTVIDSLKAILAYMTDMNISQIEGYTSIIIVPGYTFKLCKALVTNFHQPGSTLILLVAAFVGDNWKNIYDYALNNEFRFLSYGDTSLLLPY